MTRVADNRIFYDALWSASYVVPPQRFNTWPLLSRLAASAAARLEIGPGLHPRLPLAGTVFIDVSRTALAGLHPHGALTMLGEITSLPFPDDAFDLVCAFDIVEHVENDAQVFRELRRVTRDNGTIVFSVPLHQTLWTAFDDLVGHVRRYDPADLTTLLAEHSFEVVRSAGFGMGPRHRLLRDFAVWGLTRHRIKAMRWYNTFFLPLALRLQRRLDWAPGFADASRMSDVLLVCEATERAAPIPERYVSRAITNATVGPE